MIQSPLPPRLPRSVPIERNATARRIVAGRLIAVRRIGVGLR